MREGRRDDGIGPPLPPLSTTGGKSCEKSATDRAGRSMGPAGGAVVPVHPIKIAQAALLVVLTVVGVFVARSAGSSDMEADSAETR